MRMLGSVLLGLLGFWLYRLQGAPSDDVIRFGLGSAPVLVAFLRLGFAPGVLAALVAYLPFFAGSAWAVAVPDALQCLAAAYTYRSLGSLVGSVALYWLVVGWAVDLLLLGPAGAGPETLTLTFLRQLLSGLLSALAAEVVIRLPAVASRLAWPAAGRLQTFLFGRVAFVAALPALAIALPYTHGAHQRLLERATASRQSSARRVESGLRQFFTERERDIETLAREVEAAPDVAARASRLASFHGGRPYFWVALADVSDIVVASSPRLSARGVALLGERLSPPLPLSTARVEQRTAWSGLLLDDVQSPSPGEARAALMLAMPIDGRGGPAGTLVASIDSTALRPLVGDPHLSPQATVSLLDGRGHVVTSTDSRFRPGDQFLPAADDASPRNAVRLALEPSGFVVVVERSPGSLGGELVNLAGQVVAFLLGALSFAFVSALGFARRASGLLRAVDHAATGLRDGHSTDPVVLRPLTDSPIAEVRALAGRFADMHSAVAYQDALTGLPNRRLFLDRLGVAIAQAMRRHESLAVLVVNIDRFRAVNESLGRELGSLLLKLVAERLQGLTRSADTLACLGGDEFALLAPGSGPEAGAETAKRLLAVARQPYRVDGREVFLTFSIGVSEFPNDGHDGEALLRNAAAASADSKDQGASDTFRLFTPSFNRKAMERLAVEGGLRRALTNSEFRLHYQPLVEVRSGRIEGVEALIRWEQPGTGLVSPGEFIPVAESSKLIVAIGQWALPTACAQVEQWRRRGHGALTLALNLSARHLQEGNLVADVGQALADSGLAPGALELEVTESAAIRDIEKTIATLLALRGLGVRIAVDDFGTGYSSLSYLRRLPIDTVKIDRSFVGNVTNDPGDAAIATAILAMAQSLKLRVVAEGVETEEQLAFLRARACDTFQGYLFSRPLPAGELEALLAKSAPAPAHRETQP